MDTTAPDIEFDSEGNCNYCRDFLSHTPAVRISGGNPDEAISELVRSLQKNGRGKRYDCIVGVSGGVDSSYTLHKVVELGLRPLAVHLDNGWNSEVAVSNISSLVRSLKVDLHTHVIDWKENRDLQRPFFKANVVDIEMLMDNAMQALNYAQARRFGLRYILAGTNRATEGVRMPPGWVHCKLDARNIRAIQQRFGTIRIKTHPIISTFGFAFCRIVRRIRWVSFLDLLDYRKADALEVLQREHGYKPYPYKHYESVFTRFYQACILPEKFGYDKRRVHLSTLILTGQMTRTEALDLLATPPYPNEEERLRDKTFVLKKLGFDEGEFAAYLASPQIPHSAYPSEQARFNRLVRLGNAAGVGRGI